MHVSCVLADIHRERVFAFKKQGAGYEMGITIKYEMGNNNNAHLTAHKRYCLKCENNMRVR